MIKKICIVIVAIHMYMQEDYLINTFMGIRYKQEAGPDRHINLSLRGIDIFNYIFRFMHLQPITFFFSSTHNPEP